MLPVFPGFADHVFAESSTNEEWKKRGDDFYKHNLYHVAAKCYNMSGNLREEKMALAQYHALEAAKLRDQPFRMREEFLYVAEQYLECGMKLEATKCLVNAKEHLLAAELYEKTGQVLKLLWHT